MSGNKLDQFFKNKLDQVPPGGFNAEHWDQARQMLAQKKKDRYGILFIVLLGLLSIVGGYFYLIDETPASSELNPGPKQEMSVFPIDDPEGFSQDYKDDRNEQPENFRAGLLPMVSLPQPSMISKSKVAQMRETVVNQSAGKINDSEVVGLLDGSPTAEPHPIDRQIPLNGLENSALHLTPELPASGISKILDPIEFFLDYQYTVSKSAEKPILLREKIKRTRFAWSGTLLLNPTRDTRSPVQGLLLGVLYEKYLRPGWLLGIRPSLQLQANQSAFSKFEEVTTYGFSAINTTYGLQAENLQFFSAPLYIATELGKHTFELGISLDLLLSARGKLQEIAIEDQVVSKIKDLGTGWIETDDMQQLTTNLFLGYKSAINNRLKTGITFFYNPSKLYPGIPNDNRPQITHARWYIGWQANYYIR